MVGSWSRQGPYPGFIEPALAQLRLTEPGGPNAGLFRPPYFSPLRGLAGTTSGNILEKLSQHH